MAKFIHVVLRTPPQDNKLPVYARMVLDAMTGNPDFPDPDPPLSLLEGRIKVLEEATVDAMIRYPGAAKKREAARGRVKEVLQHLRDYVQGVAESQAGPFDLYAIHALVRSAGMDLRKVTPRPRWVFAAKHGPFAGSVDLTAPMSPKRDPHDWQISTDQIHWTALPVTRQASTRVTGLAIGVTYYFRHRLVTKDGYAEWSDPILMVVK